MNILNIIPSCVQLSQLFVHQDVCRLCSVWHGLLPRGIQNKYVWSHERSRRFYCFRYFYIVKYQIYLKHFTQIRTIWYVIAIWVVCFAVQFPNHVGWGKTKYSFMLRHCTLDTDLYSYGLFFAAVLVTAICKRFWDFSYE